MGSMRSYAIGVRPPMMKWLLASTRGKSAHSASGDHILDLGDVRVRENTWGR